MNVNHTRPPFVRNILIAAMAMVFICIAGQSVVFAQIDPQPVTTPRPRKPLPEPANPKIPFLILIGDSTVRNGQGDGGGGQWGWGEPLVEYFDAAKINVANRAIGGLSSRTYLTGGFWDKTLPMIKPGDFVMIQFGHNDGGEVNDPARARASIKGTGSETVEIDNVLTKKHETVYTYGWYLRKFIADIRAKGATPILCSLIPRKIWKDGKIVRNSTDYGKWAADVAVSDKVPFIDLNNVIAEEYDKMGEAKVDPMFGDPHTHTSLAGAQMNAEIVVKGLKAMKKDPLANFYSEKGKQIRKIGK
ncbi:hypothetical protein BH10ACI2_BH10ACI2_25140 [soil metagenome]